MNEIIPFGKYKNQPIEALAGDKQYTEWLCQQDWFINKHNQLHTIIINNFNQPVDTPEHNRMVAKFLDDKICKELLFRMKNWQNEMIKDIEWNANHNNDSTELLESAKSGLFTIEIVISDKSFETKSGSDVRIFGDLNALYVKENRRYYIGCEELNIECKPFISEDYPAVIRQCKNQNSNVLVFGEFQTESISLEEFIEMFKEIHIIKLEWLNTSNYEAQSKPLQF